MQPGCIIGSDKIQLPQQPLFSTGGNRLPIFDLKGAPIVSAPVSPGGFEEKVQKQPISFDQDINYFTDENYISKTPDTRNILDTSSEFIRNTTLKYPNTTDGEIYNCKFVCLHKRIFGVETLSLQISAVFEGTRPGMKIFHLCIPVGFASQLPDQKENLFLKAWLKGSLPREGGLTFNELLNFNSSSTQPIQFTTAEYCLKLKTFSPSTTNCKYTLCIFNTPLFFDAEPPIPKYSWVASLNSPIANMRTDFSLIFNFMYRNLIRKDLGTWGFQGRGITNSGVKNGDIVIEPPNYRQISIEPYFSSNRTDAVKPVYYNVLNKNLVKLASLKKEQGRRSLSGVKCYPIDLANQIDDQGNIVIDEETKQPIDVFEARETMSATDQQDITGKSLEQQEYMENLFVYGITLLGILVALIIILVIVIRVFPGTSFSGTIKSISGIPKQASSTIPAVGAGVST